MLILLTGNCGCGKTTAGDFFHTKLGFEMEAFADPLKTFGLAVGFTDEQMYGDERNKFHPWFRMSGRKFLESLTSAYKPVKILSMEKKIQDAINRGKDLVITDGRFLDEEKLVKQYGGKIIRIYGNDDHKKEPEYELAKMRPDITVANTGDREEFYRNLLSAYLTEKHLVPNINKLMPNSHTTCVISSLFSGDVKLVYDYTEGSYEGVTVAIYQFQDNGKPYWVIASMMYGSCEACDSYSGISKQEDMDATVLSTVKGLVVVDKLPEELEDIYFNSYSDGPKHYKEWREKFTA